MTITRSIDKSLNLTDLKDQLRFLEEGGFVITSLTATTNTTDKSEFNEVEMVGRTSGLPAPLELFTASSPEALDPMAAEKIAKGFTIPFLSDEVFVEGRRIPVGAARKAAVDAGVPGPVPALSLSWDDTPKRKTWSFQLTDSVIRRKTQLDQGNPEAFLTGYSTLSASLQIKFWAELLIAVAKFESDWNPHNIFHEPPPLNNDSIGLFQLSYSDEVPYKLEHLDPGAKSLEDPLVNLRCGVKIFATLVAKDKTVASSNGNEHRGAARYWSVLRTGSKHHLDDIKALTKKHVGL